MNIGEICTREIVMADREASLQQAASLMREHHVGALLVVASAADRMQSLDEAIAVGHALRGGIEREAAERAPLAPVQAPAVRIPAYPLS